MAFGFHQQNYWAEFRNKVVVTFAFVSEGLVSKQLKKENLK